MLFSTVELIFDGNSELVELFKAEFSTSSKDPMVGKIFVQMVRKPKKPLNRLTNFSLVG